MNTPKDEKPREPGLSSEPKTGFSGTAAPAPQSPPASIHASRSASSSGENPRGYQSVTDSTTDKASSVASEVKKTAETTARALKEQASELTSHLGYEIGAMAEDQKLHGTEGMRHFARAINSAAAELEGQSPTVARHVHDAACQLENLSDHIRRRNVKELISEGSEVARSQPALFFAGAVAAGFVLARFLKSSADHGSRSITSPEHHGQGRATPGEAAGQPLATSSTGFPSEEARHGRS